MNPFRDDDREWLETDGLGGFASGTVCGVRTRRYHALLLAAVEPPTGRYVLVNGWEVWLNCGGQRYFLTSQQYAPDVVHPAGRDAIVGFESEPWPQWTFQFDNGLKIRQELFCPHGVAGLAARWSTLKGPRRQSLGPLRLCARLLLSGRDYHSLHHENESFRFAGRAENGMVAWEVYQGLPGIKALFNGTYQSDPIWYRDFLYRQERERGLDCTEDLASPGIIRWDLSGESAVLILNAQGIPGALPIPSPPANKLFERLEAAERGRRGRFQSPLHRAADQYIVSRDHSSTAAGPMNGKEAAGKTVIAGYPWFADWGRDTFIAIRGLCIASGRMDVARQILSAWASVISQGMLPNRFPDAGDVPEYNSVDASLWYAIAAYDYLQADTAGGIARFKPHHRPIIDAIFSIVAGYAKGTRFGIRVDDDGLLFAGQPGWQLTWMDAKVGDWVVTPRIGKPVEVQALWLNAIWIARALAARLNASDRDRRAAAAPTRRRSADQPSKLGAVDSLDLTAMLETGQTAFANRFWNESKGYLCDVVDVAYQRGVDDVSLRPNQIFAVGGLPLSLVDPIKARQVVDVVERRLLTPVGIRSLDPEHSDYKPAYRGGVWERDGAYHQGTVWPWLLGPFFEAWLRVHKPTAANRRQASQRFLRPWLDQLESNGLGHVSEVADGDPPHRAGGCPFQAWSLAELLRAQSLVQSQAQSSVAPVSPISRKIGRR